MDEGRGTIRMIKRVLITGANGFVGRRACRDLAQAGFEVTAAVRRLHAETNEITGATRVVAVGELGTETLWDQAFQGGVDAVVHLAARVHQFNDKHQNPLDEYRKVNVQATEQLIRASANAGIRRFVYISSMKVVGEGQSTPYTDESPNMPAGPYAISKWEAEQSLQKLARTMGIEWVVLRPPLVYGPGVKANFYRLMKAVNQGIPLPLGEVKNKRSLLFVGNLVDAIRVAFDSPSAAGKTFVLSDGEDLSTAELIQKMAAALNRPSRLIPVPASWLFLSGKLLGRSTEVQRLLESFTIDSSRIRSQLEWSPPFSVDQGMKETAQWFQTQVICS
jgi:nucleoside-diphosphate-sugar epimerase